MEGDDVVVLMRTVMYVVVAEVTTVVGVPGNLSESV